MRIACVAPAYPYRGGISHFATRLGIELTKSNEILFINYSRLYPNLLFPGKTQFDTSKSSIFIDNQRLIDSLYPISWIKTANYINKFEPELVIFHWWHPFFAPAIRTIGSKLSKVRKIAICHNVSPHENNLFNKYLTRFGLAGMTGYVVHGKSEGIILNTIIGKNEQAVLFHPLYDIFPDTGLTKSAARENLGISDDSYVALYFGLIRPYKGVDVLIDAMQQLNHIKELRLLVVGEIYSNRDELLRKINSLVSSRVKLVDEYIPNELIEQYFKAADIVVLPYLTATQSGIVPIAYYYNRPVIVSNVGALPEVVEHGSSGYLVIPGDSNSLAHTLTYHFMDKDNPSMDDGIRSVKARLSWSRYTSELLTFAERL